MTSECRSCHAPIVWAKTTRGNRIPVDPDPVENGNLVFETSDLYRRVRYVTPGDGTHVSHFATCPNSRAHRRNK